MQEFLDNYELKITNYELFSCIIQKKAVPLYPIKYPDI